MHFVGSQESVSYYPTLVATLLEQTRKRKPQEAVRSRKNFDCTTTPGGMTPEDILDEDLSIVFVESSLEVNREPTVENLNGYSATGRDLHLHPSTSTFTVVEIDTPGINISNSHNSRSKGGSFISNYDAKISFRYSYLCW